MHLQGEGLLLRLGRLVNRERCQLLGGRAHGGGFADSVITCQYAFSSTSFDVKVQEEEAADGQHGVETVGYLAIEAGAGQAGTTRFVAGTTGDKVRHKWRGLATSAIRL